MFCYEVPSVIYTVSWRNLIKMSCGINRSNGPSWSYDSWIYNCLCNQFLFPL